MDVINLISKDQGFPEDDGSISPGDGRRYYTDGPRVHEYIKELYAKVFGPYNLVTVGEMSSTTLEHCIRYSNPEEKEFSMTFNFHHLKVDYRNRQKWELKPYDFEELKQLFTKWQSGMQRGGLERALLEQPRSAAGLVPFCGRRNLPGGECQDAGDDTPRAAGYTVCVPG